MKKLAIFLSIIVTYFFLITSVMAQEHHPDELMVIETDFGIIEIAFFPDKAPHHVETIKNLVREGFYNGTTFHRVIPGFMIQGGDPNSKDDDPDNDGMGGPGFTLKAEFNDLPHERGMCSMARSFHPDSAGSQFFIMVEPAHHLDGQYTIWGRVIAGMEVVDRIANVPRDRRDRPLEPVRMHRVFLMVP